MTRLCPLAVAAALVLAGCATQEPTASNSPAPTEPDSGNTAPTDDTTSLCIAYETFLQSEDEQSRIEAAADLEAELGADAPPGVVQALVDVQAGAEAELGTIDGYVGPICLPDEMDGFEGEGRAENALTAEQVCLGLHEAWEDDDQVAAEAYATAEAIDVLFAVEFSPPANSAIGGQLPDCFYNIPDGIAEVVLAGDGHVGWNATEVIWHDNVEFFADADLSARFEAS